MGQGQKFLTQVDSGQFLLLGLGWVSHLGFGFEKFPLKIPNFSILSLWIKKPHQVRSKSTWIEGRLASYLPRVRSGPISSKGGLNLEVYDSNPGLAPA